MPFNSLDDLLSSLGARGAQRVLCKPLAENDNKKQQVYLGGNFEAIGALPFAEIARDDSRGASNLKARIDLWWINEAGHAVKAPGAQLILYPKYPEVRLSGFLRGCPIAPSELMDPVPRGLRRTNNAQDGRVLFLAPVQDGRVFAYLAAPGSAVAEEFFERGAQSPMRQVGVFLELMIRGFTSRLALIEKLTEIHRAGWYSSRRLNSSGQFVPYLARNAGGTTLEALFGIAPNSRSEPDYLGWELKAHSRDRITLMTPEPDLGYYGQQGVEAFVRKYGHAADATTQYFTGLHKVGQPCAGTLQTLVLTGFDAERGTVDPAGGVHLIDSLGELSAGWSYPRLIDHWARKHQSAAYVRYEARGGPPASEYQYLSPVRLAEGTQFPLLLAGLQSGVVVLDPGSRVRVINGRKSVKARNQFRTTLSKLPALYARCEEIELAE